MNWTSICAPYVPYASSDRSNLCPAFPVSLFSSVIFAMPRYFIEKSKKKSTKLGSSLTHTIQAIGWRATNQLILISGSFVWFLSVNGTFPSRMDFYLKRRGSAASLRWHVRGHVHPDDDSFFAFSNLHGHLVVDEENDLIWLIWWLWFDKCLSRLFIFENRVDYAVYILPNFANLYLYTNRPSISIVQPPSSVYPI